MSGFCLQTETVEEPIEDEEEAEKPAKSEDEDDEDAEVEEEKEDKPKTRSVTKTNWDWELINDTKPIWTRKWVLCKDVSSQPVYWSSQSFVVFKVAGSLGT